jgi:hypothetical protein
MPKGGRSKFLECLRASGPVVLSGLRSATTSTSGRRYSEINLTKLRSGKSSATFMQRSHRVDADLPDDRRPFRSLRRHKTLSALRGKYERLGACSTKRAHLRIVGRSQHRHIELVDHGLFGIGWREQGQPGRALVVLKASLGGRRDVRQCCHALAACNRERPASPFLIRPMTFGRRWNPSGTSSGYA